MDFDFDIAAEDGETERKEIKEARKKEDKEERRVVGKEFLVSGRSTHQRVVR